MFSKIEDDLLNRELSMPDGSKISAYKYIKEVVLPFMPICEYIVLKNGNKLPFSHFIIECIIYDCQERFNGDFSKYLEENVDFDKTKQVNDVVGSKKATR